ncbi:phosphodiester glycosidase family protein [Plastorhodobacter daqingensis]|uniref:Phosphodiester glycosidase family protein n=1 Tax=Plastorhodobacter daqingensis TaxID=1387281 RepID=A0ABW2ULW5_9RHOB
MHWLSMLLGLVSLGAATPAVAGACMQLDHDGNRYTVCEVVAGRDDLRMWLTAPDGAVFGSFDRVNASLADQGLRLGFAMNAGMYHSDRSPVGLYRDPDGAAGDLVTSAGPGNFGLLPNGVFCIAGDRFQVVESRIFSREQPECDYATQSGPMLVIDGDLHPRFLVDATSRYVRNGVGVSEDGSRAWFAISERRVTFHEFGRLFRDGLGTPNALYFDGNISRLHAPDLRRNDWGLPLGPIVGTVVPIDDQSPGG